MCHIIYQCRILVKSTPDLETFHPKCVKKSKYLCMYMKSRESIICDVETYTLYGFRILSKCYINWYSFH